MTTPISPRAQTPEPSKPCQRSTENPRTRRTLQFALLPPQFLKLAWIREQPRCCWSQALLNWKPGTEGLGAKNPKLQDRRAAEQDSKPTLASIVVVPQDTEPGLSIHPGAMINIPPVSEVVDVFAASGSGLRCSCRCWRGLRLQGERVWIFGDMDLQDNRHPNPDTKACNNRPQVRMSASHMKRRKY